MLFVLQDLITLATGRFEPAPIDDANAAAFLADYAGAVERPQRLCQGRSMDTKHCGEQFVGERDLFVPEQIVGGEQPPHAALLHRMKHVARGHLHAANEHQV